MTVGNLLDSRELEQRDEKAVGDGGMCTQRMRRARYRQDCLESFEIESGASQAATQGGIHERCHEALSEDGKMILLINQTSIGREGGLLGGVLAYQETGLTGPLSIYKVVPKVHESLPRNGSASARLHFLAGSRSICPS